MFYNFEPDYIIGDLHLGGDCGLFDKEYSEHFNSVEEYEEAIVANYNKKVTNDNAIVFFLGDIGNKKGIEQHITRMRGRKFLILGNHDHYSVDYYLQFFEAVSKSPVFVHPRLVLSHIPIPTEPGVINIHGHTHNIYLDSERHINVCPEYNGYIPLLYKKLKNYLLSTTPKPNHHFLKEWYADIQKTRKADREDLILTEDGRIDVEKSLPLVIRKKYARRITRLEDDGKFKEAEDIQMELMDFLDS